MKYNAQGFEVQTEVARPVRRKRGLTISRYGTSNPVSKHENILNIHREVADNFPKNLFSRN